MELTVRINDLVEGCKKGDRKSQEALYKLYASKMLGVCMRYARDNFEAEDLLQTGFMKMFNNINNFNNEGSFEGWLRRIMVNNAIELYRKNLRMLAIIDSNESTEDIQSTGLNPAHKLHTDDLLQVIQELAPGYRLIFNMYAIEGYNHKEIAAELGISEGTSKSQLARARVLLQQKIKNQETNYRHEEIKH